MNAEQATKAVIDYLFQLADSDPNGPDANNHAFYPDEIRQAVTLIWNQSHPGARCVDCYLVKPDVRYRVNPYDIEAGLDHTYANLCDSCADGRRNDY